MAATVTFRDRLEYWGLSSFVWLIGRLPFFAIRRVADVLGAIAYLVDARGRKVAMANLDAAFGDSFTPARKRRIARGSYQTFARSMLELFWAPNLTKENSDRLVHEEGLALSSCHKDPSQPVIYVCLHYSNFEWLSLLAPWRTRAGIVVTQRFKNPLIGQIFDRLRSCTGHEIIPQERAMIRMLKHLRGGGIFHMLIDLNLDPDEASVIIDEFGELKTSVTQMHAALALRTGAKIVLAESRPLPDGTYRMIAHKPLEFSPDATAAEITQQCWDLLEPSIREQPECWLWAYKHWRFKPADDAGGRYPFYANAAKRFDKLLKKATL